MFIVVCCECVRARNLSTALECFVAVSCAAGHLLTTFPGPSIYLRAQRSEYGVEMWREWVVRTYRAEWHG